MSGAGPLPNFFIAGAGKAGTTSLYRYLAQHPQIYMSPIKEPSYFASEVRPGNLDPDFARRSGRFLESPDGARVPWIAAGWQDYRSLFLGVKDEIAIGDATPSYLWSPTAAANIHAKIPDAKIVMILRDPAERAYSHYLHQWAEGLAAVSFRAHIEACLRADRNKLGPLYPFLEVGLYYEQVKRYLALFPRGNIRVYWYEEDWPDPRRLLADLFAFLGVDPRFEPDLSERSLTRRAPRLGPLHRFLKQRCQSWSALWAALPEPVRRPLRGIAFRNARDLKMDPRDRRFLIDYYAADVRKLSELLGRDLGRWLR